MRANPEYISPAQVRQLIIAASTIWQDKDLAKTSGMTFDEWRADVCESLTGQTSFRGITPDQWAKVAKVFGVDPAPSWQGRGRRKAPFNKGQYFLRKIIEEHRLREEYVATVCDSIYGDGNWRALPDAQAKQLGHILKRKTRPGGGDCPAGV